VRTSSYVDPGDPGKARELLETVLDLEPDDGPTLYNVACTLSQLGEHDRALDLLERIEMQKMANKEWVKKDPDFAPIREHPRFLAIMDSIPD
jgi:adenylate cyclase